MYSRRMIQSCLAVALASLGLGIQDPIQDRVASLMHSMSVEERISQLMSCHLHTKDVPDFFKTWKSGYGTVALASNSALDHAQSANLLQKLSQNSTRLGIPVAVRAEMDHSAGYVGSTIYPMPILMGCSFNNSLVEAVGNFSASQARAVGVAQSYGPVVQVATDPRFGRSEENFGADPLLVTQMGRAHAIGLQGRDGAGGPSSYLGSPATKVVATAKHAFAYGAGGKDGIAADMSERSLFDVYMRPWRALSSERSGVRVRGIMASHEAINWVPAHSNRRLMNDVFRGTFGFGDGIITSDNENVRWLQDGFHTASSQPLAVAQAMWATVDIDLSGASSNFYWQGMPEAIELGLVSDAALNASVARVLMNKFASGAFDSQRFCNASRATAAGDTPESRRLALDAAEQSAVLLLNRNSALPLQALAPLKSALGSQATGSDLLARASALQGVSSSTPATIAVIGPNGGCPNTSVYLRPGSSETSASGDSESNPSGIASSTCQAQKAMVGGYDSYSGSDDSPPHVIVPTLAEVLAAAAESSGSGVSVEFQQGANVMDGDSSMLPAAVALAARDDVVAVVVVVGDTGCTGVHSCSCGEVADRSELDLAGGQMPLLRGVTSAVLGRAVPVPVIVVHVGGRPATFGGNATHDNTGLEGVDGLLAAYRPGQEGAMAIARLLAGVTSPGGRLAQPWPRRAGSIRAPSVPWMQPHSSMTGGLYFDDMFTPVSPLFPFGHGLAYTNFSYGTPVATISDAFDSGSALEVRVNTSFTVQVPVQNTGNTPSSTVVFVTFGTQPEGVLRWQRGLAGYARTGALAPGVKASIPVEVLPAEAFARWPMPWERSEDESAAPPGAVLPLEAGEGYVVDAGDYTLFAGGCVGGGGNWKEASPCQVQSVQVQLVGGAEFA